MTSLCVGLHRRYEEFTPALLREIQENLMQDTNDKDVGKKKRILLRLLIELFQVGLHTEEEIFHQLLRKLLGRVGKGHSETKKPIDLIGLQVFAKAAGETLMGYIPVQSKKLAHEAGVKVEDVPVKCLTSLESRRDLQMLVDEVYETLCTGLLQAHKDLVARRKKNEKDAAMHGALTEAKQTETDQAEKVLALTLYFI